MRIAMVSRELPPLGGGIGSYTEKTARALAAVGHQVHIISEAADGAPGDVVVDGVRIHRVRAPGIRPRVLGRTWAVARALRRLGALDVVQACEWGGEAWLYSVLGPAPVVTRLATPHYLVEDLNDVPASQRRRQAVSRWLERSQTRRSARVVSPTLVLADEVARRWGLPRDAIVVVPTGILRPTVDPSLVPRQLADVEYILYFGRLEARKGVDVWIDAIPDVLRRQPGLHCVFVGEDVGFEGRSFVEYARERCAEVWPRVHFLPSLPHSSLFPIVQSARLVVMPSRWENLANACLEAMVLARPVIATLGSGFEEIIADGVDGLLVPPGDSHALAAAAAAALDDPERLQRIGSAACRRAHEYDLDAMVARLVEVYDALVSETARRDAEAA